MMSQCGREMLLPLSEPIAKVRSFLILFVLLKSDLIFLNVVPEYPPRTDIGSFELVPSKDNISEFRNVYVYWQQISEYYKNGEGFNYTVTVEGDESLQPVEVSDAYAKFTGLCSDKNYTFNIWSRNKRGLSENKSTAFVPAKSIHPRAPSFSLVAYSTSTYGLIWAAPQSYRPDEPPITNYTIFWCTHDRDRPFQCKVLTRRLSRGLFNK